MERPVARIERFEDVDAWVRARELTRQLYQVTRSAEFVRDYGLRDQIRRAAVSIMSNIAEGFERGGNKEFRHFLTVAKGSAAEVRSQLYIALDAGYLTPAQFGQLHQAAIETGRLISGFIRYLDRSEFKGVKYK